MPPKKSLLVVKPQVGGHGTWEEIEIVKFDGGLRFTHSGMLPLGMPMHSWQGDWMELGYKYITRENKFGTKEGQGAWVEKRQQRGHKKGIKWEGRDNRFGLESWERKDNSIQRDT